MNSAPPVSTPSAVIWLAPAGACVGILGVTSKRPSLPVLVDSSAIDSPAEVMKTTRTRLPGAKPPALTRTRRPGATLKAACSYCPGS